MKEVWYDMGKDRYEVEIKQLREKLKVLFNLFEQTISKLMQRKAISYKDYKEILQSAYVVYEIEKAGGEVIRDE